MYMCIMIFTNICIFILLLKPDANQAAQQVSIELKEHEKVLINTHVYTCTCSGVETVHCPINLVNIWGAGQEGY